VHHRIERGQATVELALVLPFVAVVAMALLDLGLVLRDNVLCVHAAREAARALAVGEDPVGAARRRSGLGSALSVSADASTGTATVELDLAPRLAVLGRLLPGAKLRQSATMRMEVMRAPPRSTEGRTEEREGELFVERLIPVSALR
jgi:hypothetical protein